MASQSPTKQELAHRIIEIMFSDERLFNFSVDEINTWIRDQIVVLRYQPIHTLRALLNAPLSLYDVLSSERSREKAAADL